MSRVGKMPVSVPQGVDVAIATISLFREVHEWNRANLPGYVEIYLAVPMGELRRRDPKQIYARAARGELKDVAGLDFAIDEPQAPDRGVAPHRGGNVDRARTGGWWDRFRGARV